MTVARLFHVAAYVVLAVHGADAAAQVTALPSPASRGDRAGALAAAAESAYTRRDYVSAEAQYRDALLAAGPDDRRRPWLSISRALALIGAQRRSDALQYLREVQAAHRGRILAEPPLRQYFAEALAFAAAAADGVAADTLGVEDLGILQQACSAEAPRCDWWLIRAVAGRRYWSSPQLTRLVGANPVESADSVVWRRSAWRVIGRELGRRAEELGRAMRAAEAMPLFAAASAAESLAGRGDLAGRWSSLRAFYAAIVGDSLAAAGDTAGAIAHYRIAVAVGDDSASFAQANRAAMGLAFLHLAAGDGDAAERAFREALRFARGREPARAALAYEGLSLLALGEGRRDRSAALIDSALALVDGAAAAAIRDRWRHLASSEIPDRQAREAIDHEAAADSASARMLQAVAEADSLRGIGNRQSAAARLREPLRHPDPIVRAMALMSLSAIDAVQDSLPAAWRSASAAVALMPVRELVEIANVQLAFVLSLFPQRDSLLRAEAILDAATRQFSTSVDAGTGEAQMLELQERFELAFDLLVQVRIDLALIDSTGMIVDSAAVWSIVEAVERGRSRVTHRLSQRGRDVGAIGDVATVRGMYRGAGSDVLSFWLGDVYLVRAFVPVGGPATVHVSPVDGSVPWGVEEWRAALGVRSAARAEGIGVVREPEAVDSSLREVASALGLVDVARRITPGHELIILPDATLSLVPFAALPLGSGGLRLGARHPLRLLPAIEFNAPSPASMAAPGSSALVVGNPSPLPTIGPDGRSLRFADLPGAEEEARRVGRAAGDARVLLGPAATKTSVQQALTSATVVHIASHAIGYLPRERERDSFIALSTRDGRDGRLTVGDIVDGPRLRAELVVLSACQTALGALRGGEGALGFQRAFLVAGSATVIASYWEVPDAPTAYLMDRFYHHWLRDTDGPSKALSLFRAQEDMRTGASRGELPRHWSEPAAWAGFAVYGAP